MSAKHTPGPWVVEETEDTFFILQGEDSDQIATVDKAFDAGNARLIAAAPELLEALKYALAAIPKPTMQDKNAAERLATLAAIQDAIDKATGGAELEVQKGPCTKCGKMISHGYGSYLSGIFVCVPCFNADPKLKVRLKKPKAKSKGVPK